MRNPNTYCCDCNKPLYRRPSEMKKWKNFYCNECKKNHMNEFATIKNLNYYNQYIIKWKAGLVNGMKGQYQISRHIIKYLHEKYNYRCCRCSWNEINPYTKKTPLEVEHKDGNYKNNIEENLELLCPNCHSLTSTYKGANRGNGRKERKNTPD